ncbi:MULTISPECIES: non-ribosomal peptide synthetase [unclassified Kitasatospora]|uniref:non-ribosomal peptide synthetase n=1 Tax=unclassified Kitasatospora TaxID=2633591 RepID=UPI0033F91EC1
MTSLTSREPTGHELPSIAWGGEPAPAPAPGAGPLEWFDSWLAQQPDAPAVVDNTITWNYRELDRASARIMQALGGRVTRGELVGVCLERSALLVAAAVALARIGAVYLSLGAQPGAARVESITEDAGISCLLTDGTTTPPPGWTVAPADAVDGLVVAQRDGRANGAPSDAFCAVTTSGSTGKPKIALLSQGAIANLVRWTCDRLEIGPESRVGLFVGTTFDAHLKELWEALSSGATLHVAPEDARGSTAELFQWWQESGLTHCLLPTPLAELAFTQPWPVGLAMRHILVGGDRMRVRPPAKCAAVVHNVYGPAEATVLTTTHRLRPRSDDPTAIVPIGQPLTGYTVFITDEDGRILPRGRAGEVRIGGAGLALGYVDPQRTAERFVPAPAGQPYVDRVYRTGDKAVMRADGPLEFLGRMDDQVKISGARIEPAEVEAALETHHSVRHAVVVPYQGTGGGLRLAAFLLLTEGAQADEDAVLDAARARVLKQAVPAMVRFVDSFPLNGNGKVDRALLTRQAAAAASTTPGAAPTRQTPQAEDTEAFLLVACRRLLDQPDLTPADNFAESGGTSLAVARLIALIESTYPIRVKAAEVMRQPDLAALAALVATRRAASARS